MKHILIADDDPIKLRSVAESVGQLFPGAVVEAFGCQHEFLTAVCERHIKACSKSTGCLMIIGMQLSEYADGRIETRGGLYILAMLRLLHLRCPAIIISSETVDDEWARAAYDHYAGSLHYSVLMTPTSKMRELLAAYLPPEKKTTSRGGEN